MLYARFSTHMTEKNPAIEGLDSVADFPARDSSAVRRSALADGWANVPPMSGAECARALRRAGLEVELYGPDHMVAKRFGVPFVRIPLVDRLRHELVVAIAKTAGLTAAHFIAHLIG